jgi:folate-binding protein YgfZ
MNDCRAAELADRGAVRVLGNSAGAFLQGLITNDIEKTGNGAAIHAGLLSPQGKVLFDFFVVPEGQGYLLECRKEIASALRQRLLFYRLRVKVDIEEAPLKVAAAWGGSEPQPASPFRLYADPRLSDLGYRLVMPDNADLSRLGCGAATEAEYHARRIALCVPEGGLDYAFGDNFPHEALFDRLQGVDFRKGCFVGQEVVSRMEHRGTARKRIVGVSAEGPLPEPGTAITAGGNEIGTLGSTFGSEGLALLRLDRAEDARAKGLPLLAGDTPISLRLPEWAKATSAPAVEP